MIVPIDIKEALRIYARARRVKRDGFIEIAGTPEEICAKIIEDCFDKEKKYYRVSTGHFCEFYMRDFAFSCEALVKLGRENEVRSTIAYALETFEQHGRVATMITPDGIAFDFPGYGPDSFALLLYTITHTDNQDVAKKHHAFLQKEADRFVKLVIDKKTKLPYAHKRFTCMRDHAKRRAACYDAVMVAVVARECERLRITFPYKEEEIQARIIEEYWNGTYFFQDMQKQDIVMGDANVFPFWTGIINDKTMLDQAMTAIAAAGLDDPFPLRYVSAADKSREKVSMHLANLLVQDYETDSVWMHMGLCYLRVLAGQDVKRFAKHMHSYERLIRQHKTFLEVYDTHGDPLRRALYICDESMVWCATWLALKKELK